MKILNHILRIYFPWFESACSGDLCTDDREHNGTDNTDRYRVHYCEFACDGLEKAILKKSIDNLVSNICTTSRFRIAVCEFVHDMLNVSEYNN